MTTLQEYKTKKLDQQDQTSQNSLNNFKLARESKPIRAAVSGAVSGFATIPTSLLGLGEGAWDLSKNSLKAMFSDKYSMKDAALDAIKNNFWMEQTDKLDRGIRDLFGSPQWEDMTPIEQAADLGGQLIPFVGTAGTSGLIKTGKGLTNLAKKAAIKANPAIKYSKLQKVEKSAENLQNLLLPGVQITKNAPIKQKLTEGIAQTTIPLIMNEGMRAIGDQEGIFLDYGNDEKDLENVKLLKDNRSLHRKTPLTDADYLMTQIDNAAIEEEQNKQALQTVGLIGGALAGSVAATRLIKSVVNKDLTPNVDVKDENFMKSLGDKTRFDMEVADRFAFKDKAVEEGYLSPNTASELGQDFHGKVNTMYDTGKFGYGIETNIAPAELYNELNGLKINDPTTFNEIENVLSFANKLQTDTHLHNKSNVKDKNFLSPNTFMQQKIDLANKFDTNEPKIKKISRATGEGINWSDVEDATKYKEEYKIFQQGLKKLRENPVTARILDNISDISKKMLDFQVKAGIISPEYAEYLKMNRTVDGFFSYKPIKRKPNYTLWEKIKNYALNKVNKAKQHDENLQARSLPATTEIRGYFESLEESIKGTLQDVETQVVVRKVINNFLEKEKDNIRSSLSNVMKAKDDWLNALFSHKLMFTGAAKQEFFESLNNLQKNIHKKIVVKPLGKAKLYFDNVSEIDAVTLNKFVDREINYKHNFDYDVRGALEDYKQHRNGDNIITYDYNGYRYYFEVDPILARSLDFSPENLTIVGEALRDLKNFVQKTITGTLNPAFAIPSSIMSSHEGLTLLNVIGKRLRLAPNDISRIEYLKEFKYAYDQIYTEGQLQSIMEKYNTILGLMTEGIDPKFGNYLKKVNIDTIRNDLRNLLLTDIKSLGGASARPYTTERGAFYNVSQLNMNTQAFDKIKQRLNNLYGYHGAKQVINLFNNIQNGVRETPSVALLTYFGKKTGAIVNGKVADPKKLQEVIDVIGTLTANVGRSGSGAGLVGNLAKLTENFANYGNIMIKSLAPKIRASGVATGVENVIQTIKDLYDPRVSFADILQNIQKHGKDFAKNDFVKGAFISGMLPALAAYVWNNGSTKNREYYYAHSDHDKVSKLMFMNILGEGRHLYMPMDQEVALVSNIFTTMLDGVLGMSKYQENDPAFQQSKMIMKSLARSVGLDSVPALDILANMSGYEINLNMFDENGGINPLPRDKINADLSETAYENGVFSQKTHALLRSLFGNVGAIVLGVAEEGNVAANNDKILSTTIASITDNMTKSARLLTNERSLTSFNETSKTVYEKQTLLDKIASVQDKNPKQAEIYETVKMFNRNKIKPIHDEIKATRKAISTVKATGRTPNGKVLSYSDKKQTTNDLNRKLQKLFAEEYKEFNRLDNLLTQLYGNNITLKNFMQKTHGE